MTSIQQQVPGVTYTHGTPIPPGLSGFYLGKTASTKPHPTGRPIEPAATSAAATSQPIEGVTYTHGTPIPPGLSGFYLGKTASTKPHPTGRPIDPAPAAHAGVPVVPTLPESDASTPVPSGHYLG